MKPTDTPAWLNINTICTLANDDNRMIDLQTLDQVSVTRQVQPRNLLVWEPGVGAC
jgi:hypothetical protein